MNEIYQLIGDVAKAVSVEEQISNFEYAEHTQELLYAIGCPNPLTGLRATISDLIKSDEIKI